MKIRVKISLNLSYYRIITFYYQLTSVKKRKDCLYTERESYFVSVNSYIDRSDENMPSVMQPTNSPFFPP